MNLKERRINCYNPQMKKILEIGVGRIPYMIRYRTPWDLKDYYIGIDIDENNLESSKKSFEDYAQKSDSCPKNPALILADASHIEIPNEYVDEVIISNTLSAPIHHDWDRDGNKLIKKNKSKTTERKIKEKDDLEDPFYLERRNMLAEALRVLKRGGTLSIYTDLIIYGFDSYERLLEELRNTSFLDYYQDSEEAHRIDLLNVEKLKSREECCCFRAEVLPRSEVHRFFKK